MLKEVFLFEWRQQRKQGLFLFTTFFFFLLAFMIVVNTGVSVGGAAGNVHRNSPFVILQVLASISVLGLFLTTAFMANSTVRDIEYQTAPLFFTTRLTPKRYLLGRFAGSYAASAATFLGALFGLVAGAVMPWLDPEQLGAFQLQPYLFSILVIVLPNLFIAGAIFFSLASLTRSLMATYVGLVALMVSWGVSQTLLSDTEDQFLAAMLDPFGLAAISNTTRYWTVFDRNTLTPPLDGQLLWNRLLWMGLGLAMLLFAIYRFRYSTVLEGGAKKWRQRGQVAEDAAPTVAIDLHLPTAVPTYGFATRLLQLRRQVRIETGSVVRSVAFLVILLFGVANTVGNSANIGSFVGTDVLPVTYWMLTILGGSFLFLAPVILTFYAGELVWKERSLKLHEVYGALPVPNWVMVLAKAAALLMALVVVLGVGVLTAISIQLFQGYHQLELGLYFKGLIFGPGLTFALVLVLALFFQVFSKSKFVGYLLMMIYLISNIILGALDFDHNLYSFASPGLGTYSDMNGYGHFVARRFWFGLYWSLLAVAMLIAATAFWRRGTDSGWRSRWRAASSQIGPLTKLGLAASLAGFIAVGAFIFYNTNLLNKYVAGDVAEDRQAEFEKKYSHFKDRPVPKITDVRVEVEIYPEERRVEARGHYLLANKTDQSLDELHLSIGPNAEIGKLEIAGAELTEADELNGYYQYRLKEPLAPGATSRLDFEVSFDAQGFVNNGPVNQVVANGTFFNNRQFFPSLGYQAGGELQDRNKRRKAGLEPLERMPKIDDTFARRNHALSNDSDWVSFEATVSTSADQIAVTPGNLEREWRDGERRYFHYKMGVPMLNFYAFLSARYEVLRDQWRGPDGKEVKLEIFHHAGHEYNIDRMMEAIKQSLDYFGDQFSPFQFRQMRIFEFPRYASFAQSFANTVPFSESIGFIADLSDEDDLDYVFYVSAHEVAHQWWGHQVIPAAVQGSTMLIETMAQYSALMVMEKHYGRDKMRRFLKHELDRYLQSRGGELIEEQPLMLVENQAYIHYRKGSLVMYALRDYLGEEVLNGAIRSFVQKVAFQQPPYTTSAELIDEIRAVTPEHLQYVIEDLFETITLYENKVVEATYEELPDGRYKVQMELAARKLRADGQGQESEVPVADWIDVAVFSREKVDGKDEEKVLYFEKHHLTEATTQVELVVDAKPVEVGIDPYNKLIDRNPDDNRKKPELKEAA